AQWQVGAARLPDQQQPGGDVVGVDGGVVGDVGPSGRDVREGERGAARPADGGERVHDAAVQPQRLGAVALGEVVRARVGGGDHGGPVAGRAGAADRLAVAGRPVEGRGEHVVADRVVDHARDQLAARDGRDRGAEERQADGEVGRPVDGVDVPADVAVAALDAALLPHDEAAG